MDVEPEWFRKWSESFAPVYFVIVVVPKDVPDWVAHPATSTVHRAAAYWVRFDATKHSKKIQVPKSQRLSLETVHAWKLELDQLLEVAS
ncbi:conserved hypothetical protein [Frigoribacterium sp. 9N]|nr:conserved hypothetical protein [Frigoribacterium sp. 9N]